MKQHLAGVLILQADKLKFLVTGGAGFIGSHTARRLVALGHEVTIVDNLSNGRLSNVPAGVEFIEADLSLEQTYKGLEHLEVDAVIHLAAQSSGALSFDDSILDMNSHVPASLHLLRWCLENGVRRFLFSSSTTTYGVPKYLPLDENHPQQPQTYYAAGKIAVEGYLRLFQTLGIDTTILRLPNVYGPGQNLENRDQGMISIYLSYMLENKPIIVKGSPDRFRDFIHVDDVVEGFICALNNPVSYGRTYNLGSGEKTTVQEILDALVQAFGVEDYPIIFKDGTPGDQFGVVCDVSLAAGELGWRAVVGLAEGLAGVVAAERGNAI